MPHTKTPGGQAASDKFQKQEAAAKGPSASTNPGDAPVASDSYTSTVGVDASANNPGEKGDKSVRVGEMGSESINQGNMK